MPFVAPWLRGPDVIGALSAGAHAGLGRAQLDTSAAESADNLRLAYSRLGQQAAEEAANRQMQHELALAHLQQAQRQQDLMNQFRQQSIEARNRGLDISQEGVDLREETADKRKVPGGPRPLGEGKLTDLQKHDLDRASEDLSAAQKGHSAAVAKGDAEEVEAAKAALDAAREAYRKTRGQFDEAKPPAPPAPNIYIGEKMVPTSPGSKWLMPGGIRGGPTVQAEPAAQPAVPEETAAATSPEEPPKVTTKKDYDALPSGTIYIGKDGKKYRKP